MASWLYGNLRVKWFQKCFTSDICDDIVMISPEFVTTQPRNEDCHSDLACWKLWLTFLYDEMSLQGIFWVVIWIDCMLNICQKMQMWFDCPLNVQFVHTSIYFSIFCSLLLESWKCAQVQIKHSKDINEWQKLFIKTSFPTFPL